VTEDLVFKKADAIVGGREHVVANGKLEERSRPDSTNNFQARYAIRHEWTGAIACKDPRRGIWGGPPAGESGGGVKAAMDLAFAPRGAVQLPALVRQDIPELEVKASQDQDLTIGGARLVEVDIQASNGVVHIVDKVLQPGGGKKK
jgi:hypothetical protein